MRLTTLGTGTVALAAGRSCAGHLLDTGPVRLLLDCGSGVTQRLAQQGDGWWDITHVAITHYHTDHFGDLPTLVFAWKHARRPGREAPLVILGPVGLRSLLERLAAAHGEWLLDPGFPLEVVELAPDGEHALADGVLLAARKVPHTPESVAYSITHGRRRVVYTGDTGYDPGLAEWATGCDVLLCECSLPDRLAIPLHLTPGQCGALAAIARPRLLALTHLYPPVLDEDIAALVRTRWAGDVTIAHDGWSTTREDMPCWW